MMSLGHVLEESFEIAWEYLDRTGEIDDPAVASRYLADTIELMIRRGQRSRLLLSNRAITAYQRFKHSNAADSGSERASR
ncbi:MAG: hypothetical protein JWP25_143 [Bradyrhizobium sp.]|jgi:hypothetical protein|nr:hypothetical protein [Bradyrhizobium sp.]